jgi:hypothetical protein
MPKEKESAKEKTRASNKAKVAIAIALLVVIAAAIAIYFLAKEKKGEKIIGTFEYGGFYYTIEDFGGLVFYHTIFFFPKKNLTYNLYLRNDPRTNNVSVDINLKEIKALTYVAIDKAFENVKCSLLPVASFNLAQFLNALNINVEAAIFYENYSMPTYNNYLVIPNYEFSNEHNVTVVVLKASNATNASRIYNVGNTIVIEVKTNANGKKGGEERAGEGKEEGEKRTEAKESKSCDVMLPSERFLLFLVEKLKVRGEIVPLKPSEIGQKTEG